MFWACECRFEDTEQRPRHYLTFLAGRAKYLCGALFLWCSFSQVLMANLLATNAWDPAEVESHKGSWQWFWKSWWNTVCFHWLSPTHRQTYLVTQWSTVLGLDPAHTEHVFCRHLSLLCRFGLEREREEELLWCS